MSVNAPEAPRVTLDDLLAHRRGAGVDNTGNVRVWEAEHVLAGLMLSLRWDGADVCELGAGMAGCAGVSALVRGARRACLTDGNDKCVAALADNALRHERAEARRVVWSERGLEEDTSDLAGSFDAVVGADCLFFEDFHHALCATTAALLRPESRPTALPARATWTALVHAASGFSEFAADVELSRAGDELPTSRAPFAAFIAPSRGGSLERFAALCNEVPTGLDAVVFDHAEDCVWTRRDASSSPADTFADPKDIAAQGDAAAIALVLVRRRPT